MNYEETDFRKWLVFSSCAGDHKKATQLFNTIKKGKNSNNFEFSKVQRGSEIIYKIIENENQSTLALNASTINEILEYMSEHYLSREENHKSQDFLENDSYSKTNTQNVKLQSKPENHLFRGRKTSVKKGKNSFLLFYLSKISNPNKFKHILNFSLLGLLIMQLVILPSHLGPPPNSNDFLTYIAILPIPLFSYLSVWVYSVNYKDIKGYWKIFKFIMSCCLLIFLWIAIEISFIQMLISGEFSLLFLVVICFIELVSGTFIGLILTAIVYFAKGGKVVEIR